jgi:molecular chaperone GrpE
MAKKQEEKTEVNNHEDNVQVTPNDNVDSGKLAEEELLAENEAKKSRMSKKSKKDKESEKIEELGNKLNDLADRHLRLQADFDNFRKRSLKEKAELIKSGGESVLTSLLPIIDDFDRALSTMSEISEDDPAKIGFLLIFSKFKDFLKQNQVNEIEALGRDFDVDMHDAITKIPVPDEKLKGKIVDVVQKGYLLNSKVIRFAKVVIGD